MSAPQPRRLCDPCRIRPAPPAPREQGALRNVSTSSPSGTFSVHVFSLGDRPSGKERQKCSRAGPECGNRGWAGFINHPVIPWAGVKGIAPHPTPGVISLASRPNSNQAFDGSFQSADLFEGVLGPLGTCSGALREMRKGGLFHQKVK